MRILQIGGTYTGAQKLIEGAIHRQLLAQGHESGILYAVGRPDGPGICCYETAFENFLRRGLRKLLGKYPGFSCLSTWRLLRQVDAFRPELVHLHTLHHGYMDYRMLLKHLAKRRIPVVYTLHDMWPFTGGCYHYAGIGCEGYHSGCGMCPDQTDLDCPRHLTGRSLKEKLKLYRALKSIDFVAVSPWVREEAVGSALNGFPLHTIPNAVPLPEAEPEAEAPGEGPLRIIGVAASWDEGKGIGRFLKLAKQTQGICEITLVGSVSEAVRAAAPRNLHFTGTVADRQALFERYAASDLHVSMSLEETFGMTFVEAALVGRRSLGFASTAVAQVVAAVGGFTVPAGDVDAMVRKLEELAQDRKKCILSQQEREEIVERFGVDAMAERYLALYRKRLEQN